MIFVSPLMPIYEDPSTWIPFHLRPNGIPYVADDYVAGGKIVVPPLTKAPPNPKGTGKYLTDANIILADPAWLLRLYYQLPHWTTNLAFIPDPTFNWFNRYAMQWLNVNSIGIGQSLSTPGSLQYMYGGAQVIEVVWIDRIYKIRDDLRRVKITNDKGGITEVEGLVDLAPKRYLEPQLPHMNMLELVGTFVVGVISVIPGMVAISPFLNAALAVTKTGLTIASAVVDAKTAVNKARQAGEFLSRVQTGAYNITEKRNLELLIEAGILTNGRDYDSAITYPTDQHAWTMALAIGLPHPAMIDLNAITPDIQKKMLLDAIKKLYRWFHAKVQAQMEDVLQYHGVYWALQLFRWPAVSSQVIDYQLSEYHGLAPILKLEGTNISILRAAVPGRGEAWLRLDDYPEVAGPVKNWLLVQQSPEVVDPAKISALKGAIAQTQNPTLLGAVPSEVMPMPPVGLRSTPLLPILTGPVTSPFTGLAGSSLVSPVPTGTTGSAGAGRSGPSWGLAGSEAGGVVALALAALWFLGKPRRP